MTVEEDETIMPMKEVIAKPRGIVKSCDHRASLGFLANRAKSGSFTMSVAKLLIEDMMPETMAHPNASPVLVEPWWTMGPIPWALRMAQMK